jgi:ABC-2 type transport system permease protein
MKKILNIMWKDTILRFSSKVELLFFFILPVTFTFILAGGTGAQNYDDRIRLLVADQAGSDLSQQIIADLEGSQTVNPDVMSLAEAEEVFGDREASSLLIIPVECDSTALQMGDIVLELRQQPNNLNALAAQQAVQSALHNLGSAAGIARLTVTTAAAIAEIDQSAGQALFDTALRSAREMLEGSPDRLEIVLAGTADPISYDPAANSSAGQLITWVFIPLIGLSATFAYERQRGTLRRLLTTPTSKGTILLSTIVGNVLWALAQMVLLMVFGALVMHVAWADQPAGMALIMVTSCLAAAALGTMLATFVKTEGQASGLSIMLGMVMALLGGCWYPLELFPGVMQQVVKVLPTTWAMQGMLDLLVKGQSLSGVLLEAGVLTAFAALFFVIGILRFKFE